MSVQRNYTDSELEEFAQEMSNGARELLIAGGVLPASVATEDRQLTSNDVSRLIEVAKDEYENHERQLVI